MNLSTARSANRAKEVGIRKVAGSSRVDLITQFLTESVLTSFFSLLLAIGIAALLLPLFNQLAAKQMSVWTLFSTWLLPVLIALILLVGCIAGSYPAFYLSSFQPVHDYHIRFCVHNIFCSIEAMGIRTCKCKISAILQQHCNGISQRIAIIKYDYFDTAHLSLFICEIMFICRAINYQIW